MQSSHTPDGLASGPAAAAGNSLTENCNQINELRGTRNQPTAGMGDTANPPDLPRRQPLPKAGICGPSPQSQGEPSGSGEGHAKTQVTEPLGLRTWVGCWWTIRRRGAGVHLGRAGPGADLSPEPTPPDVTVGSHVVTTGEVLSPADPAPLAESNLDSLVAAMQASLATSNPVSPRLYRRAR
jgi:hypothetical protein